MENKHTYLLELVKYPVLVFSIVLALVVLKYALGLQIGVLTEVSTSGVKFSEQSNQATLTAITELESKLADLSAKVSAIEERGPLLGANESGAEETSRSWDSEAFRASQTVSDETAKIAKISNKYYEKSEQKVERLKGWMWLGDYSDTWSKTTIASLNSGQPIDMAPQNIVVGTDYRVLGNMVVRAGLPPNNKEYFRAQPNLGVIPRNSKIRILKEPEGVDREFAVQYWAEVELLESAD